MNNLKSVRMDDHSILMAVTALISAIGLKEIWSIFKQKIDINAKKEERSDSMYAQQVAVLSNKIQQLETKIELLIEENIQLRVKVVKMEARLINSAKKKVNKRKDEKS
jgi:regulator of replication initiation timing